MKGLYEHLDNIEQLTTLAEENIERLKETVRGSQKALKVWQGLLEFSKTCLKLADEEATETKKGQLRYKWNKLNIQGSKVWTSEAGDVNLKAWGKYQGFPHGLENSRPFADGDRSANHVAHRPKKDEFDEDTTDFDTLIDCQLAVEVAHENWKKKLAK
ncbi:MAG: hypothetical protein G01um101444_270 [Parcubacteria group bacterium Gr01-1014_44]|nr:MAG: hypothetical protein G01um101444_270 [Parcubacteria group bacterium Gr01-1014_44]